MVDIMGSTRNNSSKDFKIIQLSIIFQTTFIDNIVEVLTHISSVNLVVIKVVSVNSLEFVSEVFDSIFWDLREQGSPLLFMINIQESEG